VPPLPEEFAQECQSAEEFGSNYQVPKTRILGYCCPTCGEGKLSSLREAIDHCRSAEDPVQIVTEDSENNAPVPTIAAGVETQMPQINAAPALPGVPGEPVAYDSHGRPIIARQVDPETGHGRTVVMNDDGTCDVFGKQTIASLMSSTENEAHDWIQVLTDYQLRGLVHEIGQRLLETSQTYQARLSQWEQISEKANLEFFGLSADATDRELDQAYRQLSKKMHPDKNGGTEESKRRFQEMKTRYEELKKKRNAADAEQEKQVDAQEDEQPKGNDDKTIEFDPNNRDSLHETARKMLQQLSTLDTGMINLVQQLKRHGL
jgi:hypothetical protein